MHICCASLAVGGGVGVMPSGYAQRAAVPLPECAIGCGCEEGQRRACLVRTCQAFIPRINR